MTAHGKGRPAGDGAASKNPFVQEDSTGAFAPLMWALKRAPLVTASGGKVDQAAMLVLIHLATWANHNSLKAWPSVASVAERSGLTDETVRRAFGRLDAAGLIVNDGVTESGTTRWLLRTDLERAERDLTPAEQGRAKRRKAAAARNKAYRARQRDALAVRHADGAEDDRDALEDRHVTHLEGVRDASESRPVTHWDAKERPTFELPLNVQEMNVQLSEGASPAARRDLDDDESKLEEHATAEPSETTEADSPAVPAALKDEERRDGDESPVAEVPSPRDGSEPDDHAWADHLADADAPEREDPPAVEDPIKAWSEDAWKALQRRSPDLAERQFHPEALASLGHQASKGVEFARERLVRLQVPLPPMPQLAG